ncbi:MAG TPA: YafY family protein, partial [Thermomicrobiales bacterium]|nr:YafY family protein [Thermomicrobiales bacterium]
MYHPTTRVLAVLDLLQSRHRISGAELAERLEVDGRTVRRYITILQDLGIPIEGERGRHGAYCLRPGFKLPPLMLSDDEALAVVLGLLAAQRLGMTAAAPAVEGALAKVERVLPEALRAQLQAVQDALVIDLPPPESSPDSDIVVLLSTAAHEGRGLRLRYRSAGGGSDTEREVDPYGLVYRAGRWYMAGYCHLRTDTRLFRVDRILKAELSEATFTRPANFDCLGFLHHTLATIPEGWEVEVLLKTTLAEAAHSVSPTLALLNEMRDGVLLRCHVSDLDWLARYLVGLPFPLVIRRPPELRAALRRLAEDIMSMA